MYEALIEGNQKYTNGVQVKCNWSFYLNQNNDEELYKIMENKSILSGESDKICGFTSTFIEAKGTLRVVLTVTLHNAVNENLETVSAERIFYVR